MRRDINDIMAEQNEAAARHMGILPPGDEPAYLTMKRTDHEVREWLDAQENRSVVHAEQVEAARGRGRKITAFACVVMFLLLPLACGCNTAPRNAAAVADVRAANAGADAYVEAAQVGVRAAKPHSDTTGKVLLTTADTHLDSARDKISESDAATDRLRAAIASLERTIDEAAHRYDRLEGRWYVRWGRRIETAFWIIVGVYLLLGLGGALLTAFGGGMWFSVGKFILNLLALSNPFSALSRVLEKRRKVSALEANP